METQQKKGIQLNQAFGAILVVILVAVLVIIGIYMFGSIGTAVGSTNSTTIVNETFNPTTAGTLVAQAGACNFANFQVSQVYNATNTLLGAGNYTVGSTGTIANTSVSSANGNSGWKATYTFTNGGGACNAAQNTISQFSSYPALVGLVGTIVLLGIIIGVLVASFVFGGRKEA